MSIRHQPKSDKYPFYSPTTSGLYIALRDYIIELVCLNVNPKIGPRFWSDSSYWGPKYRREIRGVSNLNKELDLTNTLTQTALIQIIKEYNIKALVAKKTIVKIVRLTNRRIAQLKDQRKLLTGKQQQVKIDIKKNSTFIDTGRKSRFARVKEKDHG